MTQKINPQILDRINAAFNASRNATGTVQGFMNEWFGDYMTFIEAEEEKPELDIRKNKKGIRINFRIIAECDICGTKYETSIAAQPGLPNECVECHLKGMTPEQKNAIRAGHTQ